MLVQASFGRNAGANSRNVQALQGLSFGPSGQGIGIGLSMLNQVLAKCAVRPISEFDSLHESASMACMTENALAVIHAPCAAPADVRCSHACHAGQRSAVLPVH